MPVRKTYKKRYYPKKRKTYNGRLQTYSRAGAQLYKDVNMLKNLINVEFKASGDSQNVASSAIAQFFLMNGLTRGDQINQRGGRQVRFKSIQLKGTISRSSASTGVGDRLRIVVFIDKQANASAPSFSDLFENVLGATPNVSTFRNLDNRKRFVILNDRVYNLDADDPSREYNYYRKLDMKTIYDDGNAGTIADITTNSLYVMVVSNTSVNPPQFNFAYRTRYIDN